MQWWHAMTIGQWRSRQQDRRRLQRLADRLQGRAGVQGLLCRDDDRGDRRLSAPATRRDIVQVFEVGTATMMAAKGAVKPVYQLMADAGEPFDPSAYLPAVTGYYSTADGKMLSLPFNSSTPVVYWNKDAFKKAGLDPEKPPKTWPETVRRAEETARRGLAVRLYLGLGELGRRSRISAPGTISRSRTEANGLGGPDRGARVQQPDRHAPYRQPRRGREGQELRLWRPHDRARAEIHQRRLRDDPGSPRPPTACSRAAPSSSSASPSCPITPMSRARRRTRSSAAPACG